MRSCAKDRYEHGKYVTNVLWGPQILDRNSYWTVIWPTVVCIAFNVHLHRNVAGTKKYDRYTPWTVV